MTRARWLGLVAFVSAACAVSMGACTVFDGLSADTTDGGTTQDAGDSGTKEGGDAGPVPAGFLSLEDAARFCTNAIKCPYLGGSTVGSVDIPIDGLNYTSCINWLTGPLPPDRLGVAEARVALTCAARATTCQAAGACMWYELVDPNDTRCKGYDGGANRQCAEDGGAVYACSGGVIFHCQDPYFPPGSTCIQGVDKVRWCALAKNCAIQTQCQGGYLEFCGANSNVLEGYSCTTEGMTCGFDTASSTTDCLTNGVAKPCTTTGIACAGNLVSVCDGAYTTLFNCGALGGTCDGLGLPRCKLPNETCTPQDPSVNKCNGNVISLCVAGQPTSLDCTKLGMKCAPAANGASPHCE
jgi:predicted small metal-binding protein